MIERRQNSSLPPPGHVTPLDGVLVVDKPAGPTSHDVVDAIRRKFGIRKVGHGGTLDPQATGILIILLGRGTKLANRFIGSDKCYEGTMRMGVETDSQDAQGKVLRESDCSGVTQEQIETEMRQFTGDILQTPPMVSAVKVDGVPLYKRARKGQVVEREARLIHVYEFRITGFRLPDVDFMLRCTKGTYVRTICADIGSHLGCGAMLSNLRRTRSGEIGIEIATPAREILEMNGEALRQRVMPLRNFLA
jgi:tRNA pseudouridine55 synthase